MTRSMTAMTWTEYRDAVAGGAAVLVPVGSIEQHGHHLPLETDISIATRLAERVASECNAVVGPPIPFGYKSQAMSGGGQIFPGTTSLEGQTLTLLARDVARELLRHGVRRILFLSGHGENQFFLFEAADLALAGRNDAKILVTGWWQHVPDALLHDLFDGDFPGWDLEHAATVETALMLALAPDSVRRDRIIDEIVPQVPGYSVFPQPAGLVPASGLLSRATPANVAMGERLVDTIVAALRDVVAAEFS
jgi:creatinine amidohydrolase